MASSGSFNTNAYSGRYLTFSWEIQSQDVTNNTTTIAWKLVGAGGSGYYTSGNFKVVIAGETVYSSSTRINLYNGTQVASGTKVITHNTDGTKTFSASAEAGIYYVAVNCSGSGSWGIDAIPRTSTISCPSTAIGKTARIAVNRASSNFWHQIRYEFGSLSGECGVTDTTYLNWTIPNSFYDEIGNYTSKSCKLICYTYINGSTTLVGESSTTFLVTVDAGTNKPVLMVDVYDDNATTVYLTGDEGTMIRYYSNIHYDMNDSYGTNGADIVSYQAKCGSTTRTAAEDIFSRARSEVFTFTITDSRGAVTIQEVVLPVIDYIDLDCNLKVGNPTVSGNVNLTISGSYFNGSFGKMNNSLAVEYRYKEAGGAYTSWKNAGSPSISGNTYTVTTTVSGLDSTKTYVFEARAIDELEVANNTADAVKSEPIFDWGANDFRFNVPMATNSDFNVKGVMNLVGDLVQTRDGLGEPMEIIDAGDNGGSPYFSYGHYLNNYGTTGYYGNQINMRSKGDTVIRSNDSDIYFRTDSGNVYINGNVLDIETGEWYPFIYGLKTSATGKGYYMRIGEMCIVSFYVTGTVNSEQDYCRILEGYLPYAADGQKWYGGGGNVTNGHMDAEDAFSGWTLESDGHIYARTTTDVDIDGTKSSGYVGLIAGKTIHAAGTIMYHIDSSELASVATYGLRGGNNLLNPDGKPRRVKFGYKEFDESQWLSKGELAEEGNA